jgi:hypothetical protein
MADTTINNNYISQSIYDKWIITTELHQLIAYINYRHNQSNKYRNPKIHIENQDEYYVTIYRSCNRYRFKITYQNRLYHSLYCQLDNNPLIYIGSFQRVSRIINNIRNIYKPYRLLCGY